MDEDLSAWALLRIQRLLPLDQQSLKEVIQYSLSLPKPETAEHLKNLLGDSPSALEFISSFNQRRKSPQTEADSSSLHEAVPRTKGRPPKKKPNIHTLPPRQLTQQSDNASAYVKPSEDDYMAASKNHSSKNAATRDSPSSLSTANRHGPSTVRAKLGTDFPPSGTSKASPSIHKPVSTSSKPSARPDNRQTKVTVVGGKAMHGDSSTLSDLDSAIRTLEIQTNPILSSSDEDDTRRQCNCMATTHPLLTVAPNCQNCGKIICVKQGLGPCTYCKKPLLTGEELHNILRVLKDERGQERQHLHNSSHKRAEISQKPKAFSGRDFLSASAGTSATTSLLHSNTASPLQSRSSSPQPSTTLPSTVGHDGLSKAKEHRDKLLSFQAQNARRTHIHDEASDYQMPVIAGDGSGPRGSIWASPAERALELKKQQRMMREMEFNAKPDWEKKKVVGSIDISSGRLVRRFVTQEHIDTEDSDFSQDERPSSGVFKSSSPEPAGGSLSQNPLLGHLLRPIWKSNETSDVPKDKGKDRKVQQGSMSAWRRVQDDLDDNENLILDGGLKGSIKGVEVI